MRKKFKKVPKIKNKNNLSNIKIKMCKGSIYPQKCSNFKKKNQNIDYKKSRV